MQIKHLFCLRRDVRRTDVQVIFLLRAADHDWKNLARSFSRSYVDFCAGVPHRMIVVFKGFDMTLLAEARSVLSSIDYEVCLTADRGLDLQTYFEAARICKSGLICFLNSHSNILCPNWLAKLAKALLLPDVGLAGATGSFERQQLDHFPPFPNAHLRTTCFIIDRDELLASHSSGLFETKSDAYLFESGFESLTQHMLRRGRRVCVVGRNGKVYDPKDWPFSGTFRQGDQSNLLVSDNHTRHYRDGDRATKKMLSILAWGTDRTTEPRHRLSFMRGLFNQNGRTKSFSSN